MYNLENEVKLPNPVVTENRWVPLSNLKVLKVDFSVMTLYKKKEPCDVYY